MISRMLVPIVIAAVVVVVLLALYLVVVYNRLVDLRNRVENAWAQIDVQLRRRYDLIPNLVETVKGYAAHEQETLERVVAARQRGIAADTVPTQAEAENVITSALRQVFALSEAYPQLRANENFLQLQDELGVTESRIAYARQFYNDAVVRHNTRVETIPDVVVAKAIGMTPRAYFEIEGEAAGPVEVDF
jgi:LemA protein